MSERRLIIREDRTPAGFVRVSLSHGGPDPAYIIVAAERQDVVLLELGQAEAVMHMLADALTIARHGGGA